MHSTGSRITALHKGGVKTLLMHISLLLYDIHFSRQPRHHKIDPNTMPHWLIHHYAIKMIAWLNDQFLQNHLHAAFTKSKSPCLISINKPPPLTNGKMHQSNRHLTLNGRGGGVLVIFLCAPFHALCSCHSFLVFVNLVRLYQHVIWQ